MVRFPALAALSLLTAFRLAAAEAKDAKAADEDREPAPVVTDLASVGDFIRLYTSRNDRRLSPKFICGESYGTTRAAGLSEYLQDRYRLSSAAP